MTAFWIAAALCLAMAVAAVARPLLRSAPRSVSVAAGGSVACATIAIFVVSGGPPQAGASFEARLTQLAERAPETLSHPERLALLTELTGRYPDDADGWRFLGQELAVASRYFEAINVLRRSVALEPDVEAWALLAAVTVAFDGGEVSPAAEESYRQVLALDSGNIEAQWHLGLARFQAGDRAEATNLWSALVKSVEPDHPARAAVAIAAVDQLATPQRGPDSGSGAPFAQVGEGDPSAIIEGMIAGLAARLEIEPDDLSGWLVLARTTSTLGDPDRARAALAEARDILAEDDGANILLDAAETRFGLVEASEEDAHSN